MMSRRTLIAAVLVSSLWPVLPAEAQPLGSFRWQLQPYCNIITVAVVQQGGQYQLDGTDDQCGATQAASVRGMAFQNPAGSIGFGLTIVTAPGGAPVHVDATISITTLSGTWRDSAGDNGNFIFTPGAGTGGGARPLPGGPRAAFASGQQLLMLSTADATVRTIMLVAPAAGTVIVNASGYFEFTNPSPTLTEYGRCSITTGTFVDFTHLMAASDARSVDTVNAAAAFGGTRGFTVGPGPFTVNLVCDSFAGDVELHDSSLTAMFIGG